ncbi:MAG: hypothetical protein HOB84_14980 [Candidatus Marinimicrobia bacterium]|jgi:hypothetical protein|nr:hypothetical protein [Candidatus Neomarinimicrobiota bacterium]MBT4360692.1 hypothetical protein [Candidatus Neomarinimicrobiota bacterium]MBT4716071.1 hypothetical protein [Candidatus Neomarinimicrobiota bacterium]MBT4946077.1 hypothetical protein [Candidatus Neomarinimicrobiota bacterium]MBT5269523.1 hypothetical protein [Candidatus Neomarinimicrobiota bacterium]
MEEKRARENRPSNSALSAEKQSQAGDFGLVDLASLFRSVLAEQAAPPQQIIINGDNTHVILPQDQSHLPNNKFISDHSPNTKSVNPILLEPEQARPSGILVQNRMFLLPGSTIKNANNNQAFWSDSNGKMCTTPIPIQNCLFDCIIYHHWRASDEDLQPLTIHEAVPPDHIKLLKGNSDRFDGIWMKQYKSQSRYKLHDEIKKLFGFELIEVNDGVITLSSKFIYDLHISPEGFPKVPTNLF